MLCTVESICLSIVRKATILQKLLGQKPCSNFHAVWLECEHSICYVCSRFLKKLNLCQCNLNSAQCKAAICDIIQVIPIKNNSASAGHVAERVKKVCEVVKPHPLIAGNGFRPRLWFLSFTSDFSPPAQHIFVAVKAPNGKLQFSKGWVPYITAQLCVLHSHFIIKYSTSFRQKKCLRNSCVNSLLHCSLPVSACLPCI